MCIHRRKLNQPCRSCESISERMDRAFDRDVFFGRLNDRGYSELEWKASRHAGEPWR
jgi:hypothetical protein